MTLEVIGRLIVHNQKLTSDTKNFCNDADCVCKMIHQYIKVSQVFRTRKNFHCFQLHNLCMQKQYMDGYMCHFYGEDGAIVLCLRGAGSLCFFFWILTVVFEGFSCIKN